MASQLMCAPDSDKENSIAIISTAVPALQSASLSNPLYYLENFQTVIRWVLAHHADLLLQDEQALLVQLLNQSEAGQAIVARLVMRKGELFRRDTLAYDEIPSIDDALHELAQSDWVDLEPNLDAHDLYRLCRRAELHTLLSDAGYGFAKNIRKSELFDPLLELGEEQGSRILRDWWPDNSIHIVGLRNGALLERVRLMFFGNLYQDWSEFVLAELGHQRYESVEFSLQSRAFKSRRELDDYIAIHQCQVRLFEEEPVADILRDCPSQLGNPWLEHRRQRMMFQLAQQAERMADVDLAIHIYSNNPLDEAQVRLYRLQEKNRSDIELMLVQLENTLLNIRRPEPRLHLSRIAHRLRRKAKLATTAPVKSIIPTHHFQLVKGEDRVELAALNELAKEEGVVGAYCENTLFTGLFALLMWPVLYAPLPGAFFHPFQAGPADLFRPDFAVLRQREIDARLGLLKTGEYRSAMLACWDAKQGIACTLIHWPSLPKSLLEHALAYIPAEHLELVFRHLLSDLRNHRRGMPDLIVFNLNQHTYRLVEVKGPGDRLQDHQRLWIETMLAAGLPVSVAEIRWEDAP
ncbi:VRR-NUC domain-containing protein [uncultured Zhongshania sp.]|uniref:VRR-NUC domain-containing protein n=1 Tax=uncultured Zhongshania sp. TaxID=1642288 RepID=UPI0030DA988B